MNKMIKNMMLVLSLGFVAHVQSMNFLKTGLNFASNWFNGIADFKSVDGSVACHFENGTVKVTLIENNETTNYVIVDTKETTFAKDLNNFCFKSQAKKATTSSNVTVVDGLEVAAKEAVTKSFSKRIFDINSRLDEINFELKLIGTREKVENKYDMALKNFNKYEIKRKEIIEKFGAENLGMVNELADFARQNYVQALENLNKLNDLEKVREMLLSELDKKTSVALELSNKLNLLENKNVNKKIDLLGIVGANENETKDLLKDVENEIKLENISKKIRKNEINDIKNKFADLKK